MAEKTITISGAEPLLLFGFNDVYLRRIESAFPDTRITARGNKLFLKGDADSLQRIEQVVNELTIVLNRNGNLTENDVDTILALTTTSDGSPASQDAKDVVLFTPGGGMIRPRTPNQARLVESARANDIVFAIGPAGTGKTYLAVAMAVAALKSKQVKRIVLARPAVEAGERLGFLPGDLREKVDPYLRPLYDALEDMMSPDKLRTAMEQNVVEIVPLAYMRGVRTLQDLQRIAADDHHIGRAAGEQCGNDRLGMARGQPSGRVVEQFDEPVGSRGPRGL